MIWRALFVGVSLAAAAAVCGCSGRPGAEDGGTGTAADPAGAPDATPVQVAVARLDTLRVLVTAPGQTDVLRQVHVRAPFAGGLTGLRVADGDRVAAGDTLGTMVSLNSEAALNGARAMLASAGSRADSADAHRALALARANQIARALLAPDAGVVLQHSASPGDRLAEGDELLQLASSHSSTFIANVPQSAAAKVHAGLPATVRLAATATVIQGSVHGVLPAASSTGFTVPVRIDIGSEMPVPAVGLFGTATIVVGREAGVLAVPKEAVLTDDITGTASVAAVHHGRADWITVTRGVEDGGRIAVTGRGLAPGDTVIVSGQVGLPDSTRVHAKP